MLFTSFSSVGHSGKTDSILVSFNPDAIIDILLNKTDWQPSVGLGESEQTSELWAQILNNGSVQVDIDISASIGPDWDLGSAAGHNITYLAYNIGSGNIEITTSDLDFINDLAHNEYQTFGMWIDMPTTSTTNKNQYCNVTFTAIPD